MKAGAFSIRREKEKEINVSTRRKKEISLFHLEGKKGKIRKWSENCTRAL